MRLDIPQAAAFEKLCDLFFSAPAPTPRFQNAHSTRAARAASTSPPVADADATIRVPLPHNSCTTHTVSVDDAGLSNITSSIDNGWRGVESAGVEGEAQLPELASHGEHACVHNMHGDVHCELPSQNALVPPIPLERTEQLAEDPEIPIKHESHALQVEVDRKHLKSSRKPALFQFMIACSVFLMRKCATTFCLLHAFESNAGSLLKAMCIFHM